MGTMTISAIGIAVGGLWFWKISDKKPRTLTPAWNRATIKYRAVQNQVRIELVFLPSPLPDALGALNRAAGATTSAAHYLHLPLPQDPISTQ